MPPFSYPPLVPDPDPAPLSPSIPLNPPMVGEASPFIPADGQNRDLILDSIRAWIRHSLLQWTKAWQAYLEYWLALVGVYLNEFVTEADDYITTHAVSGYSWRVTATPINPSGTTNVTLTGVDQDHRPIVVGDLVSDETVQLHYGIVTAVIDPTHATVTYLGDLHGNSVNSIEAGDGILVDSTDPIHPIVSFDGAAYLRAGANIGLDFDTFPGSVVVSSTGGGGGGSIESVQAGANITVNTSDPLNPVVSVVQYNGLNPDNTNAANKLVQFDGEGRVNSHDPDLSNPSNVVPLGFADGRYARAGAVVASIVAGTNVHVDTADPANPVVRAGGGSEPFYMGVGPYLPGGSTQHSILMVGDVLYVCDAGNNWRRVLTNNGIVAGTGITLTDDGTHTTISASSSGGVASVDETVGSFINVDNTDPANPKVGLPALDSPANGMNFFNDTRWSIFYSANNEGLQIDTFGGHASVSAVGGDTHHHSTMNSSGNVILSASNTDDGRANELRVSELGVFLTPSGGSQGVFGNFTHEGGFSDTAPVGSMYYDTTSGVDSLLVKRNDGLYHALAWAP